MKPSLEGADARIARAQEHLEHLKSKEPMVTGTHAGWQPDAFGPLVLRIQDIPPPIVSVLIGEIIYNLRAALDYLIYQLAFLDSGSIQEGTQFPIEDKREKFDKRKTWSRKPTNNCKGKPGYIQHLSVPHQTAIEALQPYSGGYWTERLREISNPDKHRRLTMIRRALKRDTKFSMRGSHMDMNTDFAYGASFDDETGFVIETLEMLQSEVAKVIDAFKPEF